MTITKLKAKNQLTIPASIVNRMGLKIHEMFSVEAGNGYIKLTPVEVEPKYTVEELETIDHIVVKEKLQCKKFKPGKDFSVYLKKIAQL